MLPSGTNEFNLAPILGLLTPLGWALLLGLPLMTALCVWQTVRTQREGDEAMSGSWADAAKSFCGMMLASWLLVWVGKWGLQYGLGLLDTMRRG
ncbi:MAG: hypothetical protein HUU35_08225 [Armatimonadetes bacterium]|nr:hypothetical protein [Armatimonadota bacterium]